MLGVVRDNGGDDVIGSKNSFSIVFDLTNTNRNDN